jgi:hypothetical protein
MDLREGDTVASIAVVREGLLSKASHDEPAAEEPDNGQAGPEDLNKTIEAES